MSTLFKELVVPTMRSLFSFLLLGLALTYATGCIAEDPNGTDPVALASVSQNATALQNLNAAETSFKSAATQAMAASASAAGVALSTSGTQMARVPRDRTLMTNPTTAGKLALLLSRPVARRTGRYDAGFYELSGTTTAPLVHFYHPTLGKLSVAPPPPPTAEFHTPLGDDMCKDAPSLIQDYCQTIVACWGYDLFCW